MPGTRPGMTKEFVALERLKPPPRHSGRALSARYGIQGYLEKLCYIALDSGFAPAARPGMTITTPPPPTHSQTQ